MSTPSDYFLDISAATRKTTVPFAIASKEHTYGTHYSHLGIGGYMELPSIEYRNAIPSTDSISEDLFSSGRRKVGMIIYVISENKYYQLIPREINEIDITKPGEPVSLKKWLFYRSAKKTILLNPEKQNLDDFDDGTVVDELGEFGSVGAVDSATYDVISGSNDPNHCWTEVFVKGNFNSLEDLNNYISTDSSAYIGQLCSVTNENENKVYLVIQDDGSASLSLKEIGSGSSAGSEVFEEDITVSIEQGKTFGKYKSGDIIPATGKTANDVIKMACLEALEPDLSFSTSSSVPFGSEDASIVLNFNYIIKSLGAEISELKIERKRAADSNWNIVLNDKNTSSPFTDNFIQTKYNTSLINYRFTVSDSAGGAKTIEYNVTPIAYSSPSVSSINLGSESRYRGDSSTTYIATITKNSPLVKITSYKLQRNINSDGWVDVGSSIAVSTDPSTISVNIIENQSGESSLKNADTIKYRINVTDEFSSNNLTERTITFFHKCGIIYKSTDLNLNDIDSAANMTLQDTKTRTISSVTASGGNYTYYVYKSSAGNLSNVIQNDSLPVLGAFTKQSDINGSNSNGGSVSYFVYRSNSTNAFTNAKLAFS
jgi:hypothetical protein